MAATGHNRTNMNNKIYFAITNIRFENGDQKNENEEGLGRALCEFVGCRACFNFWCWGRLLKNENLGHTNRISNCFVAEYSNKRKTAKIDYNQFFMCLRTCTNLRACA